MWAQGAVTCEGVSFHFIHSSALPNLPKTQPEKRDFTIALLTSAFKLVVPEFYPEKKQSQ